MKNIFSVFVLTFMFLIFLTTCNNPFWNVVEDDLLENNNDDIPDGIVIISTGSSSRTLIPFDSADTLYGISTTIMINISGFKDDADAQNVSLVIENVDGYGNGTEELTGLSFSGYNTASNALNGIKTFNVTVTYNGIQAFSNGIAAINVTGVSNLSSSKYENYNGGIQVITVNIIDGQRTDAETEELNRAIPVTQNNIIKFNEYANTSAGLTRHYKLMENVILEIPLPGESNWTAIGRTVSFTGSFDGQGYTITNLYIIGGTSRQGMFGDIDNVCLIQNIGLVSGSVSGSSFVGGIVGFNKGSVINSYSTLNVSGLSDIGGVVGLNNGYITNSYSTGNIEGFAGGTDIGGVAGRNGGNITNSYSTGNISGLAITTRSTGGVAGRNGGIILNSYSTGNISSSGNRNGGIVGENSGDIINNVALNPKIDRLPSSHSFLIGRVLGNNIFDGMSSKNFARVDMINFDGDTIWDNKGANDIDGEDVAVDGTVPLSTVFAGWDTNIWEIPSGNLIIGGALPTLKNMPSGTQNPTLLAP